MWGWNGRGALPLSASGTGTTGGGTIGTSEEASTTKAWPRYEAEYLKRALTSERYKYDTEGLDDAQKAVYLDKVVANYKREADEVLKAEFEQWLQGQHEANDVSLDQTYRNADGKPVRRWMWRDKESEDGQGGYKVGQARAGWKHTPWGRAPLTHLDGVKDYLRNQAKSAQQKDMEMQFLAEFGPQNIEQAWMYFKHWVKGRPLSDAVGIPAHFPDKEARTVGDMMPKRIETYDDNPPDRQPGVYATDPHATNAAVSLPGEPYKSLTSDAEQSSIERVRALREQFEALMGGGNPLRREPLRDATEKAEQEEIANSHQQAVDRQNEAMEQRYRRGAAASL